MGTITQLHAPEEEVHSHPYEGSRIRHFRCPDSLDTKLDDFCERTGREASQVIRAAIQEFLDKYGRRIPPPKK